jgi:hypothetical protein
MQEGMSVSRVLTLLEGITGKATRRFKFLTNFAVGPWSYVSGLPSVQFSR